MDPISVWYSRELPGGGVVTVEQVPAPEPLLRARVLVERRTGAARRSGHAAPIVAEAEGDSRDALYDAMCRIAQSNVEVARALRVWQRKHPRA